MKYKEELFIGNEDGIVDIPDDAVIMDSTIAEGMHIDSSRLTVKALVPVGD